MKIVKIKQSEFEVAHKHRPRILKCRKCDRKFPDETSRKRHYKDKSH